ncbi:MAG: hypothetical protein ABI878_04340 [Acidobacteriota bacterium]
MSWIHLILGALVFIVFVTTGRLMSVDFPDKDLITPELRLLMRSRHIYILFSALIHLGLGLYLQLRPQTWRRIVQYAGSIILILSSSLLICAFFAETFSFQHFSAFSRYGIILSLVGIGLHLIGGFSRQKLDR